jgi:hypothetical protein
MARAGIALALAACAPIGTFRPLVPLSVEDPRELTVGWTQSFNSAAVPLGDYPFGDGPNFQIWLDGRLGPKVTFGGGVFAGQSEGLGGGLGARFVLVDGPRWRLGLDVNGGFGWVDAGMPVAFQLNPGAWLYTEPSLGLRLPGLIRLPLGLRLAFSEHGALDLEGAVEHGSTGAGGLASPTGATVGAAVALRF